MVDKDESKKKGALSLKYFGVGGRGGDSKCQENMWVLYRKLMKRYIDSLKVFAGK